MIARCSLLLVAALAATGCAVFENPMKPGLPWLPGHDGEIDQAVKVNAVWSEAVMHRQGEKPKRGFGARVFFYPSERPDADPIKAKGQLEIYVYEEENRNLHDPKPDRKFVFPAEELAKRHSKDDLGHSYNIFVPYDDAGGPRKKISIIARFAAEQGPLILTEQSKLTLPGVEPPPKPAVAENATESGVVPASFEQGAAAQETKPRRETTTIDFRSVHRPMMQAAPPKIAPERAARHAPATTERLTPSTGPAPNWPLESRSPLPKRPAPTGPISLPARGHGR